ncbi:MAG: hypothetical protein M1828_005448 [Chrysothrix sp. TS-e1954]|nr:MAG: hypothetical protein M1828_005448 [Chrysothrix sp. TS-e1954]
MLCAISGEAPHEPVASKKSGNVFEKRLIETYIADNGTDPVNGEVLSPEDLVDLKSARVVKPRPPTFTSIPSLLSTFQNEWDALALETYSLKQQLSQLRQELSTSLYNNDAAVRVIARITKERDEARDALAKLSINDQRGAASAGEDMQVDGQGLSEAIVEKVEKTHQALSKTRRKRPIPDGWATTTEIESLSSPKKPAKPALSGGARALAVDESAEQALICGNDGTGCLISLANGKVVRKIKAGDQTITDAVFWQHSDRTRHIIATSAGAVSIYEDDDAVFSFHSHSSAATSISLHPCGEILASVGQDKGVMMYDLLARKALSQIYTSSPLMKCQFHPDGHLLAAGGLDGKIQIFDVKAGEIAATFETEGPIQDFCFSENGTWLAVVTRGSTNVSIWDLRKSAELKSLDFGGVVDSIQWDYTGQYLVGGGASGVTVQQYDRSSKAWTEPLRKAADVATVKWGAEAKSLIVLTTKGALEVLQ